MRRWGTGTRRRLGAALVAAALGTAGAAMPAHAAYDPPPGCDISTDASAPTSPRPDGARLPFGFNQMANPTMKDAPLTQDEHAALEARSGATVTRTTVLWGLVEYYRDHYIWGGFDHLYCTATARGLRPLFVILSSPRWAVSEGCGPNWYCMRPPDRELEGELEEFSRAIAKRYPQAMFEAWNEPNFEPFWGPDLDPARYVDVLGAIYRGVKAGNPSAPVAGGSLMNTPYTSAAGASPAYWRMDGYLWQMYLAGAGKFMDAVSVHPYFFQRLGAPLSRFFMTFDGSDSFVGARRIMRAAGYGGRPIWATEFGIRANPHSGPNGWVTEDDAAKDLMTAYQWLDAQPDVDLAIFHTMLEDTCQLGRPCDPDATRNYSWLRQVTDDSGMAVAGRYTARAPYCAFANAYAARLDCSKPVPAE